MSTPLVAVVPTKYEPGEWQSAWMWTPNRRSRLPYRVHPAEEALLSTYDTDAHFVGYVVHLPDGRPATRQVRVVKAELAQVLRRGLRVLHYLRIADIDRPNHARMTPDTIAEASRRLGGTPYAWYPTRGGLRVLQPLTTPVDAATHEHHQTPWLVQLQQAMGSDWQVDFACRDWTRHFRLPNVLRDGHVVAARVHGLDTWQPVELPTFAPPPAAPPEPSTAVPSGDARVEAARRYAARVPVPACGSGTCEETLWSLTLNLVAGFDLRYQDGLDIVTQWARASRHKWNEKRFQRAVRDAQSASVGKGWHHVQQRRDREEQRPGGPGIGIEDDILY